MPKDEINNELSTYALYVVENNTPSQDVDKWLKMHDYSLESFLQEFILIKYGKLEDDSYRGTLETLKCVHQSELIKQRYSPRFEFAGNLQGTSPLYQEIVNLVNLKHQPEDLLYIKL